MDGWQTENYLKNCKTTKDKSEYGESAKESIPIEFMREYIQRDSMSIHDISVINQMVEAYKEHVKSDR